MSDFHPPVPAVDAQLARIQEQLRFQHFTLVSLNMQLEQINEKLERRQWQWPAAATRALVLAFAIGAGIVVAMMTASSAKEPGKIETPNMKAKAHPPAWCSAKGAPPNCIAPPKRYRTWKIR